MTDNEKHLSRIIAAATFVPKSHRAPSAWIGHLPFASWVIRELSPKVFVELGTHTGASYFTFCQSVGEAGLGTKCYAVDTWQGDKHAGHYDDQIFHQVSQYNSENYATFSQLMRMTFDDAASYFTDQSVELLHIDGLHTYEAVRNDFEKWLPKMVPGGLMLFHDTNVRERDFGVWKLLEELRGRYPFNLEFTHSYGLGIVQVNESKETDLEWLKPESTEKNLVIAFFSGLGSKEIERYNLFEAAERDKLRITTLTREVAEQEAQMLALNRAAEERNRAAEERNRAAEERNREAEKHIHSLSSSLATASDQNKSLESIVESAKKWQKRWLKRAFHRWRP